MVQPTGSEKPDNPPTNKEMIAYAFVCYVLYPILAIIHYKLIQYIGIPYSGNETLIKCGLVVWIFAPVSVFLLLFLIVMDFVYIGLDSVANLILPYM